MSDIDETNETKMIKCPKCGAEVERDAKFCTACGKSLRRQKKKEEKEEKRLPEVKRQPVPEWAVRAGGYVKKVPTGVKVAIPLIILVIIGIVVTLLVLAGNHSPKAAVEKYLSYLKQGEYQEAYEIVAKTGKFQTFEFFEQWQTTQAEELGRLKKFRINPKKEENKLFGHLLTEEESSGTPFVATLIYRDKTYEIDITVEDAGGVWPMKKYKLRLADKSTRVLASPQGSKVYVDGVLAGTSEPNQDLQDALSLGDLPGDMDEAVDYIKRLANTFGGLIDDFKQLAEGIDTIADGVQRIFNKFGQRNMPWSEVVDSVDRLVSSSKEFGKDVARLVIHIYWMFGGGDDGTIRADLTRTENILELKNLPEGYHIIEVELPGAKTVTKSFIAPDTVEVSLEPDGKTVESIENSLEAYFQERGNAMYQLNAIGLSSVAGGEVLQDDTEYVTNLAAKGVRVASDLKSLEYEKVKLLKEDVAAVWTKEEWDLITYDVATGTPVGFENKNQKVVYTLQLEDDTWKVIESRQ